ncbi:MAG TPA: FKBP-type peptidyl-prolyl cis-trans isomerase [Patescibacteria group bacterium]|nr:FKBP-type peptidyl-prolyl cis-trans isomerase [Patescibacteria group bacterium]HSX48098.1 FKBP-type peptidyl-prolyl cis-trans isomerase [Candidatus Nanoarchaeia archaeon]
MRRVVIIGSAALAFLAITGTGLWYWRVHSQTVQAPTSDGGTINLNNDQAVSEPKASELKVANSDTGQLSAGGNSLLPNNDNSSNTTTNNSATSAPKQITPQDFKQFDQYKDSQNAMYIEMKKGDGATVSMGSKVAVNYRGWLTDGREFDESVSKDKPFVFVLGQHQVIPGWEEGVADMKVGGERLLIIPPVVGYGSQGKDPIPANAVLVFDIVVLGVE